MAFGVSGLSVRAKLAIILGLTIFALAATRAFGLSQLGGFLDRFGGYVHTLETAQQALAAAASAELALARLSAAASGTGNAFREQAQAAAGEAEQALARLEALGPVVAADLDAIQALRRAVRAGAVPAGALEHPQAPALRKLAEGIAARFAEARRTADAARAKEVRIMNVTYASMLALVLAAGVTAYLLIAKMITRPLGRMVEVASLAASGDLSSRIDTSRGDELGQVMRALDDMNRSLSVLIGRVRESSIAIRAASLTIDTTNAGLAERITDQSAALEQTAAAMEQLAAAVARNAEHARGAAERAGNASRIAERGGGDVRRVAEAMDAITTAARRVTEIIGTIDGIAFQTNILALNAAVEAARAGESGRGFAVVAAEVRGLAQKSAVAAQEIKKLIEAALRSVEEGAQAVRSAGATMSDVVSAAGDVTGIVAEIAAACAQQAGAVREVNDTITRMESQTRRNSEVVERAAECAREMRGQSAALDAAVAVFRLDDEAPAGASAARARPQPSRTARALDALPAPQG